MAAENCNDDCYLFNTVEQTSTSTTLNFENDEHGNIILNIPSLNKFNENSDQLDKLLDDFNLVQVKCYLTKAAITYTSLRYLSKDDIKEAIPPIGLRAEFREKLFSWRKSEFGIDDETLSGSIASKVALWLQSQSTVTTTATPTSSFCAAVDRSQLSKKLKLVLQESLKGKALTQFYANNGYLIDSFRADLIIIILEDILFHDRKLSPKDFPPIIEEILNEFPNELKEYYFTPRGKKKNPGGKLWDRYVNQRAKRAKLSVKFSDNFEVADANAQCTTNTEIDEPILLALKVSLSRDFSNWGDIKDKWQRTFLLRQKELKTTPTNYEFLNNWPLYSNARAHELINIDFELLHPNKSHLLLSKWNEFRTKIGNYYGLHINDRKSKELLTNSKSITDPNSLDYIHTILLNAVILPTARFSDKSSKNTKKISIPDANESFIVHLTTISDYEKVISELRDKYYNKGLTIQPFLIVVGLSIYQLNEFYIYFDKHLLKFDSFLTSLDVCFKLLQALSLEYPKGCFGAWRFIQEYFYEIILANDSKLASICSLLNFLKIQ